MIKKLTRDHYNEIIGCRNGADVIGYKNAKLLREVQKIEPKYIKIVRYKGKYDVSDKLPYFGCIATKAGIEAAEQFIAGNP